MAWVGHGVSLFAVVRNGLRIGTEQCNVLLSDKGQ